MKDILFLAHRVPFPPDRGDRIRSHALLAYLSTRARVHLIAFDERGGTAIPPGLVASATLVPRRKSMLRAGAEAILQGRPVSLTAFDDAGFRRAVAARLGQGRIDAIYLFSGQMGQYAPQGGPPVVMDFVDVDSAKFAGFARRGALRWVMRREARRLAADERAVAARVDASLFVSADEAALFRAGGGGGRILVVENGIDAARFDPAAVTPIAWPRPTIVFTGQMDYRPNVEAAQRLVHRLLPQLRAIHPETDVAIVGRAPIAAVRALAGAGVTVTGEVADVRPYLAGAAACVTPLETARGVQNKVLEAMAMARPVVASQEAATGIDHGGTIRVGADDSAIVAEIAGLLGDPVAADALGQAARAQICERYGWAARLAPLDALLGLA